MKRKRERLLKLINMLENTVSAEEDEVMEDESGGEEKTEEVKQEVKTEESSSKNAQEGTSNEKVETSQNEPKEQKVYLQFQKR